MWSTVRPFWMNWLTSSKKSKAVWISFFEIWLASINGLMTESTTLNCLSILLMYPVYFEFLFIQVWIILREVYIAFPCLILLKHSTKHAWTDFS